MRIIEKGAGVKIMFEDPNTGTMLCPLSAYVVADRTLKVNVC